MQEQGWQEAHHAGDDVARPTRRTASVWERIRCAISGVLKQLYRLWPFGKKHELRQSRCDPQVLGRVPAINVSVSGVRHSASARDAVLLQDLVLDLINGLWRARSRLSSDGEESTEAKLRAVTRHMQSVWDALGTAGFEIRDETGRRFVPGAAMKVISFQPTPETTIEMVAQTVQPSIYRGDQLVQRAHVIVATPIIEQATFASTSNHEDANSEAPNQTADAPASDAPPVTAPCSPPVSQEHGSDSVSAACPSMPVVGSPGSNLHANREEGSERKEP